MKKLLAIALTLAIIIGLFPASALAMDSKYSTDAVSVTVKPLPFDDSGMNLTNVGEGIFKYYDRKSGERGLIEIATGKKLGTITESMYSSLSDFSEGLATVSMYDEWTGTTSTAIINTSGNVVRSGFTAPVSAFSGGVALVGYAGDASSYFVDSKGYWLDYIDKLSVPGARARCGAPSDGYFVAQWHVVEKWETEGVIFDDYFDVRDTKNNVVWSSPTHKEEENYFYDIIEVDRPDYLPMTETVVDGKLLVSAYDSDKTYLLDVETGRMTDVTSIQNGGYLEYVGHDRFLRGNSPESARGLVDLNGTVLYPYRYMSYMIDMDIESGLFSVSMGDQGEVFDINGKQVLSSAAAFKDGYAMVIEYDQSNWMAKGKYVATVDGVAAAASDKTTAQPSAEPSTQPSTEPTTEPSSQPAEQPTIVSVGVNPQTTGTAKQSTMSATIGDKPVELQAYKLVDSTGDTNYVKIRDIAAALDGSAAQFDVQWDGAVNLVKGTAYASRNGQENKTPYSGDQTYTKATAVTKINGKAIELQAFVLKDANGGESIYYKLRDVGQALGFNVGFTFERGLFIEPDRPYTDAD